MKQVFKRLKTGVRHLWDNRLVYLTNVLTFILSAFVFWFVVVVLLFVVVVFLICLVLSLLLSPFMMLKEWFIKGGRPRAKRLTIKR